MPPEAPNPEAIQNHRRTVYLGIRVKTLQEELKALRAEREALQAALATVADPKSPEARALKARRIYLAIRPEEARAELTKATAEREALTGKQRAA